MIPSLIQYMKDSAWQPGKKLTPAAFPPFQLPAGSEAEIIDLPEPDLLPEVNINFLEMIELRSTGRSYDLTKEITLKELSYHLWCTQGVKMVMGNKTVRNVPSAGGRNPFETLLYINRVEGLKPGLYRFLPLDHKLVYCPTGENFAQDFISKFSTAKVVETAAVIFLWVAIYERTACLFGPRAYRYIHLDAGHICENLYFSTQTMATKTCPLGAFDDEGLNSLLGLDGVERFVAYGAAIGK